ncbi:MAG: hypothetical protein KGQ66_04810 [Acidobacteriota bacterium]|nr:hypothetical protein [Acidobacteriota bacterium]
MSAPPGDSWGAPAAGPGDARSAWGAAAPAPPPADDPWTQPPTGNPPEPWALPAAGDGWDRYGEGRPPNDPTSVAIPVASRVTGPNRRRRWPARLAVVVALAAVGGGLGTLAWHNDQAATRWRRLYQAQVGVSAAAAGQIRTANDNIAALNAEKRNLNAQVATMASQLATVANQKEKAIDQTTVLKDLLSAAGQVADHLQACIAATDQLDSDLNAAVASGSTTALDALQAEAASVDSTCQQAQDGNNALQAAIRNASS